MIGFIRMVDLFLKKGDLQNYSATLPKVNSHIKNKKISVSIEKKSDVISAPPIYIYNRKKLVIKKELLVVCV